MIVESLSTVRQLHTAQMCGICVVLNAALFSTRYAVVHLSLEVPPLQDPAQWQLSRSIPPRCGKVCLIT